MERTQIEGLLKSVYAARVRGDAGAIAENFADDAVFRIAGSPQASPVPCETVGAETLRGHLEQLIQAFEFKDHQVLDVLVDGARVGVHSRVTVRSTASGETATTELFDLLEFKDGRIASMTQFIDTALAARLAGVPPP
jgi:ketosteroid isomerase-like protein